MIRKTNRTTENLCHPPGEVDGLYAEFLKLFYEEPDRRRAATIAVRLREALAASPELAESIRGEEIRSLVAEFSGDFDDAIHSREAEIRKILELFALTKNTPSWEYVAGQYDFSDVSDRLDLLAHLYERQGATGRAIATLRESRLYCNAHGIRFDGQEMLDDLEQRPTLSRSNGAAKPRNRKTPAGNR